MIANTRANSFFTDEQLRMKFADLPHTEACAGGLSYVGVRTVADLLRYGFYTVLHHPDMKSSTMVSVCDALADKGMLVAVWLGGTTAEMYTSAELVALSSEYARKLIAGREDRIELTDEERSLHLCDDLRFPFELSLRVREICPITVGEMSDFGINRILNAIGTPWVDNGIDHKLKSLLEEKDLFQRMKEPDRIIGSLYLPCPGTRRSA